MTTVEIHGLQYVGFRQPRIADPEYMAWLLEQLRTAVACDGCDEDRAHHRAHLKPKGRLGHDRNNVVLLCWTCHERQEKRTEAFEAETGVDLHAKARAWTERYEEETARGLPF